MVLTLIIPERVSGTFRGSQLILWELMTYLGICGRGACESHTRQFIVVFVLYTLHTSWCLWFLSSNVSSAFSSFWQPKNLQTSIIPPGGQSDLWRSTSLEVLICVSNLTRKPFHRNTSPHSTCTNQTHYLLIDKIKKHVRSRRACRVHFGLASTNKETEA